MNFSRPMLMDPRIELSNIAVVGQIRNVRFERNNFQGVRLHLREINELVINDNKFEGVLSSIAMEPLFHIDQTEGAVTKNLRITNNVFAADHGSLPPITITSSVRNAVNCVIGHN
jgi:hypothetical protein